MGRALGELPGVTAMTDITGFGLLGHLVEMAKGANLSVRINYAAIPVMDGAKEYLAQRIVPDATYRNWNSYSGSTGFEKGVEVMEALNLLPYPQTNGGLMSTCAQGSQKQIEEILSEHNIGYALPIGTMVARGDKIVNVFP